MSYKKITVNNQAPNASDEISLNLSDIITVASPQPNELLKKAATDWTTETPANTSKAVIDWYYNEASFSNGTYFYDQGDYFTPRRASGEFHILDNISYTTASSSYSPQTNSSLIQSFRFSPTYYPSGAVILFRAVVNPERFSGSDISVQWRVGKDVTLANSTPIGNIAYSNTKYGATAYGLYVCTETAEEIGIRVVYKTGDLELTNRAHARFQQITAKRLA